MFRCANEAKTIGNPHPQRCEYQCPSCKIWYPETNMITFICPDCGVRWKISPAPANSEVQKCCPNCNEKKE